jgi:hypothetical protein
METIQNLKPGDVIKVELKNRDRSVRKGIGHVYKNNQKLFASISWSDGNCSNCILNVFEKITRVKLTNL